jgi:DNA-binding SARP family transcriptional activator
VIRLRTLGGVSLHRNGLALTGRATQRKRIALLVLLAAAAERGLTRDKILAYLWPEHDSDRGRHALSQLLYAIRRDLGPDCIRAGIDELHLDAAAVSSDLHDFNRACDAGELELAAALHTGVFLDGFFVTNAPEFERWAEGERQRLNAAASRVFGVLGAAAIARADPRGAAEWFRRRTVLEPLNSRAFLDLLVACEAAGDRTEAMRYGLAHVALVRAELGVEADAEVTAFLRSLTRGPQPLDTAGPAIGDVPSDIAIARDEPSSPSVMRANEVEHEKPALPQPHVQSLSRAIPSRHKWLAAVSVGLVLASLSSVRWFASRNLEMQSIILGAVTGPDTSLNFAVREALEAELSAMSRVKVLSRSAVEQALTLMKREPGSQLTEPVAVEVAHRRGVAYALVASVKPVGDGAEIRARLTDTRGADEASAVFVVRTAESGMVIAEVRKLAATLGTRFGDRSRRGVPKSLPAVSTSSLPALRTYAAARQALEAGDRWRALNHGLAAVQQDSTFAMAHYLVGDLAWFLDRQTLSDKHLTAAVALSDRLPLRERLLVRARYMQIVRDNTDSALIYWYQLHAAYPQEALAYEGRAWTNRARGETEDAYRAADSALVLDPSAHAPNERNKLVALLSGVPDTARALALAESLGTWAMVEARQTAALVRHDWDGALRSIDTAYPPRGGCGNYFAAPLRHAVLIAAGRTALAARELESILCWARGPGGWPLAQMYIPNALLVQGRAEVLSNTTRQRALGYARQALDFVDSADLSIPAVARIIERAADISARGGDLASVQRARGTIVKRDDGQRFQSYQLTLLSIDAAIAFARGDFRAAAALARQSRQRSFFGRSGEIAYLLEADARAASGELALADSLYRDSRAPLAFLKRG